MKHFAEFYDVLSDRAEAKERAEKVLVYINKYFADAKSVLELGVGNGDVLSCFPEQYTLYGLDIEEEYVELARNKLPHAELYVSSMHNFEINARFDVIFSIYDSINFLESFEQWEQTFNAVHKHLDEKGLFIFDMYTPGILEKEKNELQRRDNRATFWRVPIGFVSDKAIIEGNTLTWDFKIFERVQDDLYQLHEYQFTERIFPPRRVGRALEKKFEILEKVDYDTLKQQNKHTSKLLYVTSKKY